MPPRCRVPLSACEFAAIASHGRSQAAGAAPDRGPAAPSFLCETERRLEIERALRTPWKKRAEARYSIVITQAR